MKLVNFESRSEAQQIYDATVKLSGTALVGMERRGNRFVNNDDVSIDIPWAKGEPKNAGGRENCVTVSFRQGGYNDVPCDLAYRFVCEKTI
jgi:hypothetical protein